LPGPAGPRLPDIITTLHAAAIARVRETAAHIAGSAIKRERDIAAALEAQSSCRVPLEPGLFDRRRERLAASQSLVLDEALERCRRHVAATARRSGLRLQAAELVFGAFVG
jgi:hypothetical protein